MFLIRILIIAFIIGYIVWFVNNRILGRNLALARVISATLVITSVVYLLLGSLSYLVEGF
jgi:predicted PurR-regulated permease PerM